MYLRRLGSVLSKAGNAWIDDHAQSMGAALSYYTVFSIAPLLLIAISVAGLVFGQDAAQGAVVDQLQGLIGHAGAEAIQDLLKNVSKPSHGRHRDDHRRGRAGHRRDLGVRRTAGRPQPDLAGAGQGEGVELVGVAAHAHSCRSA